MMQAGEGVRRVGKTLVWPDAQLLRCVFVGASHRERKGALEVKLTL
jgi:hypothetical protein